MRNDSLAETSVFINGALRIDYAAGCAFLGGEELHLTPIEYKLLCLLSRNVGKVLTHTYITQNIWGAVGKTISHLCEYLWRHSEKNWKKGRMRPSTSRHTSEWVIAW